jgi:hypothetical protein
LHVKSFSGKLKLQFITINGVELNID